MNGSRFHAWTRRRFGVVAGGLAWLGALVGVQDAAGREKKRCKAFSQRCKPGGKRTCCKGLRCAPKTDPERSRCCRKNGRVCSLASECCSGFCLDDRCRPGACREIGAPCDAVIPCCSGNCGEFDHCDPARG